MAYLSTWDNNPIYFQDLRRAVVCEDFSADVYDKAEAAALRVLYYQLTDLAKSGRFEKPQNYKVTAIQRSIESIPEFLRKAVIRKITQDIIRTSDGELMSLSEKVKSQTT